MDRLIQVQEREARIHFEMGCKCRTTIHLKNMMHTMPVAFKVQTTSPEKFSVKPPNGCIPPLGEYTFEVILKPQSELPDDFPLSREKFLVKSALAPINNGSTLPDRVPNDWFLSRRSQVFVDARLKVVYIGDFLLRYVTAREDMASVRNILKRQNCGNKGDEKGRTALHFAVATGNVELVDALLEAAATVDPVSQTGETPLFEAAQRGHAMAIKALLRRGANREATNSRGCTALHIAASANQLEILRILIESGAHLEATDNDGLTALHFAASEGHLECVRALLEAGADKDACSVDGRSVIFRAAAKGLSEMVDLLLDWGANAQIKAITGQSAYDVALEKGHTAILDALQLAEELLRAARKGDLKVVTRSLRKGAHVNRSDQSGWTALHCAAFKGHIEVVTKLLEYGADMRCTDTEGHTPLHCAVEGGHKEAVQLLVGKAADLINAKNARGVTALQIADTLRYTSISRFLSNRGAEVDPKRVVAVSPRVSNASPAQTLRPSTPQRSSSPQLLQQRMIKNMNRQLNGLRSEGGSPCRRLDGFPRPLQVVKETKRVCSLNRISPRKQQPLLASVKSFKQHLEDPL